MVKALLRGPCSARSCIIHHVEEAEMLCRERAASMYSALPFALAAGSVEIPYILAQALVYSPIVFFLVQFDNSGGWQFWCGH